MDSSNHYKFEKPFGTTPRTWDTFYGSPEIHVLALRVFLFLL